MIYSGELWLLERQKLILVETIQSELCKKDLDILQKQIVAEEATVRKAGGKFKMNPLFPSTTAKVQAVSSLANLQMKRLT